MKKKLILFLTVITIALSLVACGDKDEDKDVKPNGTQTTSGEVGNPILPMGKFENGTYTLEEFNIEADLGDSWKEKSIETENKEFKYDLVIEKEKAKAKETIGREDQTEKQEEKVVVVVAKKEDVDKEKIGKELMSNQMNRQGDDTYIGDKDNCYQIVTIKESEDEQYVAIIAVQAKDKGTAEDIMGKF